MGKALGLIEFIGYVPAVCAADDALKAANVELMGIEKVTGGIVTVKLTGEVDAVQAAVECAENSIGRARNLRAAHVIARIDDEVNKMLVDEINEEQLERESILVRETIEEIETKQKEIIEEIVEEPKKEISEIEKKLINTEDELYKKSLNEMSVKDLRKKARTLKVKVEAGKLKYLKKNELVDILFKYYKEGEN
ncbi:MAG: BMC domain-containing protein [Clostridium sp.]|uniref:BMC domain-containing protein n=1 Tax=Clostridium sp. TaxID=1506 RepID=UPI003F2CC2CD